jgi:hypothetical protein
VGFGEIDGFGLKGFLFEELFVRGLVGVRFEICIWGFIRGLIRYKFGWVWIFF